MACVERILERVSSLAAWAITACHQLAKKQTVSDVVDRLEQLVRRWGNPRTSESPSGLSWEQEKLG